VPEPLNNIFKPLGPAPIQDPLYGRLNLANPLGSGIAAGAINSLAMRQDLNTKSGWLYAGSVNGGVWGSKYNGTTDTWDSWQLLSNTSSYQGAQSIGQLQLTENQKWLIAGKGNPSNYAQVSGNIGNPLQVAEIQTDGTLKWLEFAPAAQTSIFDAKVTALETTGELLIIGTSEKGLNITSLDATGQLQTVSAANLGVAKDISGKFNIRSLAKGSAGRIYAAILGKGIYQTTSQELIANPNTQWNLLPGSSEKIKDKDNLRLATSKDPVTGADIIFLGTSSGNRIDTISQITFNDNGLNPIWRTENVAGLIGSGQAADYYGNFSFASDPSNHNRILAGGNQYSNFTGVASGGLVAVTYPEAGPAKLDRLFAQFNSDNSAPHADSRDIIFVSTNSGYKIIESDDGGIYQKQNDLISKWQGINKGLNTAESYASDWSNIGNLAITAMQDNSVAIGSYGEKPTWLNVYSGDGSIARFDDGIIGSDNRSRGYYSSQMYDEGQGLTCSTYDNVGILEKIEYLNLNVLDEYRNIQDFQDYDYLWLTALENGKFRYPFYQPVETNAYRAGDYVMAGMRNIYEQTSPHWLGSPGEMNLKPLLDDTEIPRIFTALSIGSNNPAGLSASSSWDSLFTSYIDTKGKTYLYGRQLSSAEAKLTALTLPNGVTAPKGRDNMITGISVNPLNTNQIYTTISKWALIYGVTYEDGDEKIGRNPQNKDDFDADSYLAYSIDAGITWQEIKAGDLNGIPKTANLQQVAFAPANANNINNQIYVGGYGGVWVASLDSNGKPGKFTIASFQGQAENAPMEIWNSNLKYDPVDDVLIASMIGQGAWLLSRSNLDTEPTIKEIPGLRIADSIIPQDSANYRNRKNRKIAQTLAINLERSDLNQDKDVSVDLQLSLGWEKYIALYLGIKPLQKGDIDQNTFRLSFPKGVNSLYLNYAVLNPAVNIPDKSITTKLINSVNADIAKATGEIYLYATADNISFYEEGDGVFYAQSEVAKKLSVLLPSASIDSGDTLYWYKVDDSNGNLGNVSPTDPFYLDFLNTPSNPNLIEISTATLNKDTRALSPDKAYWAYQKPELAMQSEGVRIGELTNLDLADKFKELKLSSNQKFALAIKDKLGNIKATPMGYKINSNMDNAISFNLNGSGAEVVLAPGNGDLFIVSADLFNGAEEFDRMTMNLDVTRVGSYASGYGLFRVDDLSGNLWSENSNFTEAPLIPGSTAYAKEALRRSLNHLSSPLDGVTGLPLPNYGSSIRHSVELATGNGYGMYITPNQILDSVDKLTDLSQILFSIKDANQDRLQQQVSMGTGYFAFEDMGFAGDRDFNDMLFAITPKNPSII